MLLKVAEVQVGSRDNLDILNGTCMLLDEGSHRTFVTERLASKLKLRITGKEQVSLATFGTDRSSGARTLPKTCLTILTTGAPVEIEALVIPDIAPPITNYDYSGLKQFDHLRNIQLVKRPRTEQLHINILLGADYYWRFVGDHTIRGESGPIAVSSNLGGYLISGPTSDSDSDRILSTLTLVNTVIVDGPPLCMDLSQYWKLESLGVTNEETLPYEEFDVGAYSDSIQFNGKQYVAKFPWKKDHDPLPTNYAVTRARTRSMVKKLSTDERLVYDRIIKDQLQRQFIEGVTITNVNRGHYLPHYGVAKDSVTTPSPENSKLLQL